jgi:hypothetical protein
VASRRILPSRISLSYDSGRLIGSGFSKTLMAVRSEKRVSSMGFEHGKPLNFRCACHGCSPAQNRSIARNERPDTLDPCLKSIQSCNVKIQLPSFPFGCYTNPTTASASFTDANTSDTHTASWNWGDGSTAGTVTESGGSGSVSDSHTYSAAGVYLGVAGVIAVMPSMT